MRNIFLGIGILTAIATAGFAEEIPNSQFSYQAWRGAAYSSDTTGAFSHCAISASYKSGNNLHFSVNSDATVTVGVSGQLGLRDGQEFPVALYVDRRAPFYGTAVALSEDFAMLKLSDFDAAMDAFKKGYLLKIEALGGSTDYSLKDTFRALNATLKCAAENYEYVAKVEREKIDKTILFQLSAIVLANLEIDDFRYFTEEELIKVGRENTVSWEAPERGMSGAFLLVPFEESGSLRQTDATDTQYMAGTCPGDYATSARAIDLGGSDEEARELLLVCKTNDAVSEIYLTKFVAGESVVYTVIKYENMSEHTESDPKQRKQESESAVLRAAAFMID